MIVGDRQENRECSVNVLTVNYDREEIFSAVKAQIDNGRYESIKIFGDGSAGRKIANELARIEIDRKKTILY